MALTPGRLRDWWTNSTVKAFEERAACIARQYSKYYVYDAEGKKVYVNGNVSAYCLAPSVGNEADDLVNKWRRSVAQKI